jgi:glucosamine--fructose-6-phosphate aminotransferase (isomerizing)
MCQLTAYIGDRPIAQTILKALELQEPYFAAHATGMGTLMNGKIAIVKAAGYVSHVKRTTRIEKLTGTTGIGHSRYSVAARDDPRCCLDSMAHPFTSDDGKIALMHNGEISNYADHWTRLKARHKFKSFNPDINWITDSEVAVHMIDDLVKQGMGYGDALKEVMPQLNGTVLLCLITESEPETVYLANRHQPCYVGVGDDETMWCSSKIGFEPIKGELKKIYQPPKNSLITLRRGRVDTEVLDRNYEVPELKLNKTLLKESIIEILKIGDLDFQRLSYAMLKGDWAKCYGIPMDDWLNLRKVRGVSVVNPFIETLDELIESGRIVQRIDRRMEGCLNDTPRFAYSLK